MAETENWFEKAHEFAVKANDYFDLAKEETSKDRQVLLNASFKESVRKAGYCLERHPDEHQPSEEQAVTIGQVAIAST